MKQTISLALVMLLAIGGAFAKDKERASKHTTVKGNDISITYGQPNKKGRLIFGDKTESALVPYGEVWRLGADEATEITLSRDCLFADHQLKAGTYTMFVIPNRSEWTVILNSELKQWGAFGYDKIKDKNVLTASVAATQQDKPVETFTISIKQGGFKMEWDKVSVFVPVKALK